MSLLTFTIEIDCIPNKAVEEELPRVVAECLNLELRDVFGSNIRSIKVKSSEGIVLESYEYSEIDSLT